MYQIHCLNKISKKGMECLSSDYSLTDVIDDANAIAVRSASMHEMNFSENLLAIARAGAGVNNIPLDKTAEKGIVVFNTPGANANAVVEMALCGLLLSARDVVGGISWVQSIKDEGDVAKKVEKGKSQFAGNEVAGKTMGVIGLGNVGGPLANAALGLGMKVYGCDPFISVDAAWHLDRRITHVKTREEIYENCDYISLHTPLLDDTKKMINAETIAKMKDGVTILNFARDALVDDEAMEAALKSGKVKHYITDFPNDKTAGMAGVIATPHLGASTEEAEDNCAVMAVTELMNYLENGNIINSVNFPNCDMGALKKPCRIAVMHKNIPNTLGRITSAVAGENLNISDMVNKSRGDYAYTMLDLDTDASEAVVEDLKKIDGIIRVRVIRK